MSLPLSWQSHYCISDLNPAAQGASLTEGKRGKRSKKQNGETNGTNGEARSGSPKSEEEPELVVNAPEKVAKVYKYMLCVMLCICVMYLSTPGVYIWGDSNCIGSIKVFILYSSIVIFT